MQPLKVGVREFLTQFVEGYLFADLDTMAKARPTGPVGHLGYPMVMTCCAGIELLGALASDQKFDRRKGRWYFAEYWTNFLYPSDGRLAYPFYRLLRHGLAHGFLTKPSIVVTKNQPEGHLTVDGARFRVDATSLASDLKHSYLAQFKPRAHGQNTQKRLDEMLEIWVHEVGNTWVDLVAASRKFPAIASGVDLPPTASSSAQIAPSGYSPDWVRCNSPAPGGDIRTAAWDDDAKD